MTNIRMVFLSDEEVADILNPTKLIRSQEEIINELNEIIREGARAVNLTVARREEIMGIELIRHARETLAASF